MSEIVENENEFFENTILAVVHPFPSIYAFASSEK